MALQLLEYPLTSQNQRVGDLGGLSSQPKKAAFPSQEDRNIQIEDAYRQVFFHAMKCDRDINLESQFRNGSITARDFIRGLLLSRRFQEGYVICNTNYRLVDQVIGRVLGRQTHGQSERISWSIRIAEKGFNTFVDEILNSDEYMQSFGYDEIPSQRTRVIPGKPTGEQPIYQQLPRYDSDWRDMQWETRIQTNNTLDAPNLQKTPEWALRAWLALITIGSIEVTRIAATLITEIYSTR